MEILHGEDELKILISIYMLFGVFVLNAQKKNVLLIIVDDLRADLNEFIDGEVHKPAIDKLSSEGVSFKRAYCQKALCVPSRQSFLTGMRPDKFGAGFNVHFRRKLPRHITLPQYFKKNGYKSVSVGKVFHHRDPVSWTEPSWVPKPKYYYPIYGTEEALKIQQEQVKAKQFFPKGKEWWASGGKWVPGLIWESPDVKDNELTDGMLADFAIDKIEELKNEPFFMAVGFFRPHLPFIAPKKYFDLYPLSSIKLSKNEALPKGTPGISAQTGGEWRKYYKVPSKGMPKEDTRKEYIRAYLASVSYVDTQIGRLLKKLNESGLEENTVVVLLSDHGYHLFDKSSFGKSTNFEDAVKVHLTIKDSSSQKPRSTSAIVELVDLYPSLCELAGLSIPSNLDGKSFKGIVAGSEVGKKAAYSQYSRNGFKGNSIRTERFRYTRWEKGSKVYEELYDFAQDQNRNVAGQKSYQDHVKHYRKKLEERN